VSGGAALQPRLARVFWAANIPVLEGYGLTETSPVIAVNNFNEGCLCFGTVGPVIDGVEVRIADDGEIIVKGPNVMLGYYNNPEATKEVIDENGWFHTGDIGMLEEGKYLRITDRKKEIFKTSGGKYIAPQLIENKLKESPFIEQVMIVGENQKFAGALIVPAFQYIKEWGQKKNIRLNTFDDIIVNEAVQSKIKEEVQRVNKQLGNYEQVKKFELIPGEWSIVSGEMTPKLSIKRKFIKEKYKSLIDKIYGN
jgi:long-chain acyl-CoA synthetase